MTTQAPMMQDVQNPELMFRGAPLPARMRARLLQLGYAPHAAQLLMEGLPIVYTEHGLVVEYPDGRRLEVERFDELGEQGEFQRYRYRLVRELPRAAR